MKPSPKYPLFVLFVLFLLYTTQGLPFGFQQTGLKVYMREHGSSLSEIGFAGLLSLPWMFKFAIAPIVDRFYSTSFGRRRSWIVPLQILLALTMLIAGWVSMTSSNLSTLMICIFCMNLFAAMQDIPVDGLAIDTLKPHALGLGNIAQVVGFKTGMVLAGGVLLALSTTIEWSGMFFWMAIITILPLFPILLLRESSVVTDVDVVSATKPSFKEITRRTVELITGQQTRWAILLIFTYKLGEELVQTMFATFLLDRGIVREQIGQWIGTYGMAASITGSVIGGLLITRYRIWSILGVGIVLRLVPLTIQWFLTQSEVTSHAVIFATVADHLAGGMLTVAMFAFMMNLVNKRVGASEYTLLASIEVLGKSPASWASGIVAQHFGYGPLFFIGLVLATLVLIPWYRCREIETT